MGPSSKTKTGHNTEIHELWGVSESMAKGTSWKRGRKGKRRNSGKREKRRKRRKSGKRGKILTRTPGSLLQNSLSQRWVHNKTGTMEQNQ